MMLEAEEKIVVKQETLLEPWKKVNQIIASVFTLIIIAVFPLFFRNYYFDILTVKYIFYYGTIISMAVVTLVVSIIFLFLDKSRYDWATIKSLKRQFSICLLYTSPCKISAKVIPLTNPPIDTNSILSEKMLMIVLPE